MSFSLLMCEYEHVPPFFETIFWSVFIISSALTVFWCIALIIRNKGAWESSKGRRSLKSNLWSKLIMGKEL